MLPIFLEEITLLDPMAPELLLRSMADKNFSFGVRACADSITELKTPDSLNP